MLHVRRATRRDITPKLQEDIYLHCALVELPDTTISKHYHWRRLARYLSDAAQDSIMYVLYSDEEPIGAMCFSTAYPVHLDCLCMVEDLLYISPEERSYKAALTLIKRATQELRKEFSETFLVFVGSTLGPAEMESLYLRAGYVKEGTHLVTELEGTKHE